MSETTASVAAETTQAAGSSWVERDRQHLWHHLATRQGGQNPLIAAAGDGPWIVDADGHRYLDAMSGLWCVNLGYSERELAQAAFDQMSTMPYFPMTQSHLPAIRLSEKLNEWLGGNYRVFFSNSGSEANDTAFKMARQIHQQRGEARRWKIISRYRAYHGNSFGAGAATGQAIRKIGYEPLAPGFLHVAPPYCYRCPFGQEYGSCQLECASNYEQIIQWEGAETIAAVVLEPTITGGGVIVPPPEYLQEVRKICDKYGVLMIVDEVICGFGRSGERFGHQNFGVQPDIITLAKGMTSGYLPLSATVVREQLFDVFQGDGPYDHFRHLNTFGGNPSACAVGVRTLELMEERDLVARSRELGEQLQALLQPLHANPHVGDIRRFGFLAGLELVTDKLSKTPAPAAFVVDVIARCKAKGVLISKNTDTVPSYNNIVTVCPPLVISDADLAFLIATLHEALTAATAALEEVTA